MGMLTMQLIDPLDMASVRATMNRKKISTVGGKGTSTIPTIDAAQLQQPNARQQGQQNEKGKRLRNKGGVCPTKKSKVWIPLGSSYGGSAV